MKKYIACIIVLNLIQSYKKSHNLVLAVNSNRTHSVITCLSALAFAGYAISKDAALSNTGFMSFRKYSQKIMNRLRL